MKILALILCYFYLMTSLGLPALAQQCGWQVGGASCRGGLCCSQKGWCGDTETYCGHGCQSNCGRQPTDVSELIDEEVFEEMLLNRNESPNCAVGFYTYDAFITAAKSFPSFGNNGTVDTRKRELAAFFGITSHETTGGWESAPDGPYSWGYCFKEEINDKSHHCVPSSQWPCVPGKNYYGRGPIQISYNYNYGPAGQAIGYNLLNDPDKVSTDPVTSFETAIWFWMTPQPPKPSCHQVMTNQWKPTAADIRARRFPGYGVVTNIINGGLECGRGYDARVADRIGFYKRYADILGVSYGHNLNCYHQRPFGSSVNQCTDKNCLLSDI